MLGVLAAHHPGVRFVDFVSFSGRAQRLLEGQDLLHPLYPIGYPALLAGSHALTGDVLVGGKVIAVLAGAVAIWGGARLVGPWGAVWLLGQGVLLTWGATEGTDMPAAALSLAALAVARDRPVAAGALVGAACLCRYTAAAAVPVVLLASGGGARGRLRLLVAFLLATAPHWGIALWQGRSPLPDQSENLAIAAGHPTALWSADTLGRLPDGLYRAWYEAVRDWPVRIAALGLLVGMWQRDRRAFLLAAWGALHLLIVGLAFAKVRLVLPTTICLALGGAWLLPRWWAALPAALIAAGLSWQDAWSVDPSESSVARIADRTADLEGPFASSSPWFYDRVDGWITGAAQIKDLGDPGMMSPETLAAAARSRGIRHIALDPGRVRSQFPALQRLMDDDGTADFAVVAKAPGWKVFRVLPASDREPGPPDREPEEGAAP